MPRVAAAFFALGVVFVIAGMCLGEYMGANNNFLYAPVHAHINLLGWVTLALCGTFYTLTRDTYSPRLAWITFGLIATGVLVMIPTLTLLLKTGDSATWGPLAGLAGGIVLLGMLASRCLGSWCASAPEFLGCSITCCWADPSN